MDISLSLLYIYTERERERERIYIYIYIERERGDINILRERETVDRTYFGVLSNYVDIHILIHVCIYI